MVALILQCCPNEKRISINIALVQISFCSLPSIFIFLPTACQLSSSSLPDVPPQKKQCSFAPRGPSESSG